MSTMSIDISEVILVFNSRTQMGWN